MHWLRYITTPLCPLLAVFLFVSGPHSANAQSYMFTDESGNIHHVSRASEVPNRYRTQVFGEQKVKLDRKSQEKLYKKYMQEEAKRAEERLLGKVTESGVAPGKLAKAQRKAEKQKRRAQRQAEKQARKEEKARKKALRKGNKSLRKEKIDVDAVDIAPPPDAIRANSTTPE